MALWTYTIVPLPDPATMVCSGATRAQLVPLASLRDVDLATNGLRDPALVQLVANVALFVPFGMLVRHLAAPNRLGRFGCIVVAGAGVSLLIELTQLTGVWGLYPCSYRLFDVDDLLTNTVGVVIGVALAPLRLVPAVHSLTLLVYLPVAIAAREAGWFGADVPYDRLRGWTMLAVAGLLLLGVPLLARGATIGQLLTYVRPVTSEGRAPSTTARLVRWVTGSGGYFVLSSLELITGQGVLGSIAAGSLVLSCAEVALRHPAAIITRELGIDAQVVGAPTARFYFPAAVIREYVRVIARAPWLHGVVGLLLAFGVGGLTWFLVS